MNDELVTSSSTGSAAAARERSSRPCPVCDCLHNRTLYRQNFARFSTGALLDSYDVVVCDRCGMAFADHIPEQATFDQYYRDMSKYEGSTDAGQPSKYDTARFRAVAEFIRKYLPERTTRILEIGCANGGLLAQLKERGYEHLLGMDPSGACAVHARNLYGIRVLTGTIAELNGQVRDHLAEIGKSDALVLAGVLEHVRDLRTAVGNLGTVLGPCGRVVLIVPDASRYDEGEDAPFQEFSVEHINFFGPTSVTNLMRTNGFAPLVVEPVMVEFGYRARTPTVCAVGELRPHDPPSADLEFDREASRGLLRYIETSRRQDGKLRDIIARIVASEVPLVVWGAGAHTLRLLAASRLADAKIVAFVDSNTRYQGKILNGVPIIAPVELRKHQEPVLISSRACQQEIAEQIRNELNLNNEIITLYSKENLSSSDQRGNG